MEIGGASLPPSEFNALLIRWNSLEAAGFADWDFLPGMRLGERQAWWRGRDREAPHEGLDICSFRTAGGARVALGPGVRVPAVWTGCVVGVLEDFLGWSVFLAHGHRDGEGRQLHSVYGHIAPGPGATVGGRIPDGGAVGRIAAPRGRRAVPPHLHLTLALIVAGPGGLDWGALRDPARAILLDPLPLLVGGRRRPTAVRQGGVLPAPG